MIIDEVYSSLGVIQILTFIHCNISKCQNGQISPTFFVKSRVFDRPHTNRMSSFGNLWDLLCQEIIKNNRFPFFQLPLRETSAERVRNACRERSLNVARGKTWWSIQDIFYKPKTISRFPKFDASNAWQMGRERFFFRWEELLMDFTTTHRSDFQCRLYSAAFEVSEHISFL